MWHCCTNYRGHVSMTVYLLTHLIKMHHITLPLEISFRINSGIIFTAVKECNSRRVLAKVNFKVNHLICSRVQGKM